MNRPIPVVIVVGFLGAGKTTFLREILPLLDERGLAPSVVINDYANARVDAVSLRKEGRPVTPVNGNCICCDSLAELIDVLLKIEETEKQLVVIEANGTTDPAVLIEHLLVKPELRERFDPLLQVAIVDLLRWQQRGDHNQLERLQVETASHILFTREETASVERFAAVQEEIDRFNPKAQWIRPQQFALELDELVRAEREAVSQDETGVEHEHGHQHTHTHDRHHLAHAFVGLELKLPTPMTEEHLQTWLASLPRDVLRAKGLVKITEESDYWVLFQRVEGIQGEVKLRKLQKNHEPAIPACAVLIGVKLDEEAIRKSLLTAGEESPSHAT